MLVGVNLLREGLDLPEVSLVAILDADKEGFLRSETSLIQTIGRAARNVNAEVILYADKVTPSMQRAIDETNRRREMQLAVQRRARHHAARRSGRRSATALEQEVAGPPDRPRGDQGQRGAVRPRGADRQLEKEMLEAAEALEFEKAAIIRDRIKELQSLPVLEKISAGVDRGEAADQGAAGLTARFRGPGERSRAEATTIEFDFTVQTGS